LSTNVLKLTTIYQNVPPRWIQGHPTIGADGWINSQCTFPD
jgi:hypothetical protein